MSNTLDISFYPDPVTPLIEKSVKEYQIAWDEHGEEIIDGIF